MTQPNYIDKDRKLRESEDFAFLRKKGLEHIEALGHKIWNEYNTSDPGITMLESLCYAITDLARRAAYPVEDIMAETGEEGGANFACRKILTSNPVTINDYRKLLIDVEGVKNAWLDTVEGDFPGVYLDCKESKLAYSASNGATELKLRGFYKVKLELDDDPEYGDMNRACVAARVRSDTASFLMEILFPRWDEFIRHACSLDYAKEFYFDENKPLGKGGAKWTYEGAFKAFFKTNTGAQDVSYGFKVYISGASAKVDEADVRKEVKKSVKEHFARVAKACKAANQAQKALQSRRNLCEDFIGISGIDVFDVAICAEVEVSPDADVNDMLSEIYLRADEYLSPEVRFYALKELLDQGLSVEDALNGPPLNHGFIRDSELEASDPMPSVHVSDLIRIIMGIDKAAAVKGIVISGFSGCMPASAGERWRLEVPQGKFPRLSLEMSKIVFFKGLIPCGADRDEAKRMFKAKTAQRGGGKLEKRDYDMPAQKGESRAIRGYYSIQNDFPLCYGIGKFGLPPSATALRKAQAKQLKAYLLFFDMMLADYLAQLARAKELLDINVKLKRTYFSQSLYRIKNGEANADVPRLAPLIKDFVESAQASVNAAAFDVDDEDALRAAWMDYVEKRTSPAENEIGKLDPDLESQEVYEERRGRFLDHIMARFAEEFGDCAAFNRTFIRGKSGQRLINDKIGFLKDYPAVSGNRAKAFDYTALPMMADDGNVSGLGARVSRLLGMGPYTRKRISNAVPKGFTLINTGNAGGGDAFIFRLINESGKIILTFAKNYSKEKDARDAIKEVIRLGRHMENYELKISSDNRYFFNILNGKKEVLAKRVEFFTTPEKRGAAIEEVMAALDESALSMEGFHIIEHILLRPNTKEDLLLPVCVEKDCSACIGFKDPYSFRITAVAAAWPERFRSMEHRRHFEEVLRAEAPAHVHVRVCWVDEDSMSKFEDAYSSWLQSAAGKDAPYEVKNTLITALSNLRSVYREAVLHSCKDAAGKNAVVLDNTRLGKTKE